MILATEALSDDSDGFPVPPLGLPLPLFVGVVVSLKKSVLF
jgi:hypothetical protein